MSSHNVRPKLQATRDALGVDALPDVRGERLAAVAVVLCEHPFEDDEVAPHLLLIQRADHPQDPWSGHLAFPGGRHDVSDSSLLATAIRETEEEIGLALAESHLVGALPPLQARGPQKGLVIAPYVFQVDHRVDFTLDTSEVASAFWVPVSSLTNGYNLTRVEVRHEEAKYYLPGYQIGPKVLWGMTYEMFQTLAKVSQWVR
jgi:8-oxo-dGTP pyrophosphatase MutT (NUDIX family)